jgi:ribonuclease P protein component
MPTADANNFAFPRTSRLKSSPQIKDVVQQRQSVFHFPIKCFYSIVETPDSTGCQVAFLVSKKRFHHAVDRNRVKRLLREAYRLNGKELTAPENRSLHLCWMFVGTELPDFHLVESAAQQIFRDLQQKLNPEE